MNQTTSDTRQTHKAPDQRQLGVLIGDRLCTKCSYNLVGQLIFREEHYQLLVVRCPECGATAPTQEYPQLGRWANRWAALVAGLWLLVLMVLFVGTAAALFGISVGLADTASGPSGFRTEMELAFEAWEREQNAAAQVTPTNPPPVQTSQAPGTTAIPTPPSALNSPSGVGNVTFTGVLPTTRQIQTQVATYRRSRAAFAQWWLGQDPHEFVARGGGWKNTFDRDALALLIPLTIVGFILGSFWGVALMARRRLGFLPWIIAIMGVAFAFACIPFFAWTLEAPYSTSAAARHFISPRALVLALMYAAAPLTVGIYLGRPLLRRLVVIMLPPRLRGSLANLWLTDGLQPPSTRG